MNSLPVGMETYWLASRLMSSGTMSGARRVETRPMETSRATSPRDRKDITFDEVPEGQQPTRMTPTASTPSRWKIQQSSTASSGMMR